MMPSEGGHGRWVDSVAELVSAIGDGEKISVSGFHFVRAPIAALTALVDRASGIKGLTYIGWGGGLPLELLLSANAVDRLVFCFSSFDVFGLAPRFRRALEQGSVVVEEWTALGFTKALEAAAEQLSYETLQAPLGSDFNRAPLVAAPTLFQDGRAPMCAAPALQPDTLLLHAQRADADGNVEIAGARGTDVSLVFAARRVLVTVEERVPNGALRGSGTFIVPRTFVTALACAPGGAYPTSCLPYYVADYRALGQLAALGAADPLEADSLRPGRGRLQAVQHIASTPPAAICRALSSASTLASDFATAYTIDELMACCIARTVDSSSICTVGSVSPLATVAYLLAKRLWAPGMCLLTFNSGFVDVPFRPMSILAAEAVDFATAVACAGGDEVYHWYYQRGLITHEVVSAAQVDRHGGTNNVLIRRPDHSTLRLPGQGGMADVANFDRDFSIYLTRQSPRNLVDRVDFVSAMRAVHRPDLRRAYGYQPGTTRLITNLGQFQYDSQARELALSHLHPGVTMADIQEQTGFPIRVSPDLLQTPPPTDLELRTLRGEVDPIGIRRLEFVPSRERSALLNELFDHEEQLLQGIGDPALQQRSTR